MSIFGYGLEPFGQGPYGGIGGVILPATSPPLGGYGGYSYGTSSYGSLGGFGSPDIAITGGYGGSAYGTGSYGSIDSLDNPPEVLSVISITGFTLEIFFSNEMSPDADLFEPSSYTLVPLLGAATSTVISVEVGVAGVFGPTSVLVNHTGTTLGGLYRVVVAGPRDIGGTEIVAYAPLNQAEVLCKGEPPTFSITPISGTELRYDFEQAMLEEASFSPGILQLDAYGFSTAYPQNIIPQGVTHPFNGDPKQVKVDVIGMTSTNYLGVVSPATAIQYDGSFLPSSPSGGFQAQELGSGTSSLGEEGLLLSKEIAFSYGWRFMDTSGKLKPDSSYRCDLKFDISESSISPVLGDGAFLLLLVNDGEVQISLTLTRSAGIDVISVESGAFSASSSIAWSTQETLVSVVRNQKADTYTVVVNGEPLVAGLTSNFTAPPGFPAGVQVTLDPNGTYKVTDFLLQEVLVTATQTVFSEAWNFLHNQSTAFVGSSENAKNFLLTQKGPLVKGWGDATPATKQDVAVKVNGVEVEVAEVNPYYGKITLTTPIPLMPPGFMAVDVDYIWFPSPTMNMAGLNTLGLVLNKVACTPLCPSGTSSVGVGLPGGGTNGVEFSRFPMGVVLPSRKSTKPLQRSPRFVAFQKAYTASLNSPTTLLLNRDPSRLALPQNSRSVEGKTVFYGSGVSPLTADPAWDLVGQQNDAGVPSSPAAPGLNFNARNEGFHQILKTTSGSYGEGQVAFYTQEIQVDRPLSIVEVPRFQVRRENLDLDGVFTGVGFGCHTNNHLYLVGALEVNGVQHIGMLVDPSRTDLVDSWKLAYTVEISILSSNTFEIPSESFPIVARENILLGRIVRIQILEGSQAGVYIVTQVSDEDGTATVTVSSDTAFPANPNLFGNRTAQASFEVIWDGGGVEGNPTVYRLVVQHDIKAFPQGRAQLFVGGALRGRALYLEGVPPFAIPPDGVLLYPTTKSGEVFFGSVSRRAKNLSDWYFVRYGIEPGVSVENFRGSVVSAEMNSLPEKDPNNIWFLTQSFGTRQIDSTGDQLLLKATSSNIEFGVEDQDLSIGYARIEPFLNRRLAVDLDTTFQIDSAILGAGDLEYIIRDGAREVRLATIMYQETVSVRSLVFPFNLSLSGLLLPNEQGWVLTGDPLEARVAGHVITLSQKVGSAVQYARPLLDADTDTPQNDGRILEARVAIKSATTPDLNGDTGIFFSTDVGPIGSSRGVGLRFRKAVGSSSPQVVLFSVETGVEVLSFNFNWEDAKFHNYRAYLDWETVTGTLTVDDALLGTFDLTLFSVSSTEVEAALGGSRVDTEATLELDSFSVVELPPSGTKRTLGVWLGGDRNDINSWEIPRVDSLTVSNSDPLANVVEMDWSKRMRVRIRRDPNWGVTVLRPDLPPPPYFTGDFATDFTEPSAGWINVEWPNLPRVSSQETLGEIRFGALDPRSISQTRIDEVRYRIYRYATENLIMPPHMVLNQYNIVNSGELLKDQSIQEVFLISKDNRTIDLKSVNITAARVFDLTYFEDSNNPFLSSSDETNATVLVEGQFEFDSSSQTISLLEGQSFVSAISLAPVSTLQATVSGTESEVPFNGVGYNSFVDVVSDNVLPSSSGPQIISNQELTSSIVNEISSLPSTAGPATSVNYLFTPTDSDSSITIEELENQIDDIGDNLFPEDSLPAENQPINVSVRVRFAPGTPSTLTYLCSRPVLDGQTVLNQDTPYYTKSQVGKDPLQLSWGSRINDPNDTLNNDPDFILNDPFRFLEFVKDPAVKYENIEFCEVSEGDECQLTPFCDDSLPGSSEAGHLGNSPGDIGNGLITVGLSGLAFTEVEPISFTDGPSDSFGASLSSTFLKTSGGDADPGGNLQGAILFTPLGPDTPSFESLNGTVGWSVFGQLYDTLTDTTQILFFGTESLGP
jgi:hypothetical protein